MANISFVLPVGGGGGGAHSVVQEVNAMRDMGIEARVLVNQRNADGFRSIYARFPWVEEGGMGVFEGPKDLATLAADADVVVRPPTPPFIPSQRPSNPHAAFASARAITCRITSHFSTAPAVRNIPWRSQASPRCGTASISRRRNG